MALALWIVMIALAAAAWFANRPGGRRGLPIGLALVDAAFSVWVILTQFSVVGYWWLIVTMALSLLVTFRSDIERLLRGRDAGDADAEVNH